jgi:hypothetical protein
MRTHHVDLNAILERVRKESYQDGYNAALQEVGRIINSKLGNSLDHTPILRPRTARHGRFVEGSFTALVLNKVEAHTDGIFAREIKNWVRSGNSAHADHPQADKRVDTALTRLKSHYGVIVKKTDGKWYPVTENASSEEQAA